MIPMQHKEHSGAISNPYKSWGEEQIARLLQRNDICFQYEYPVALIDDGHVRIFYPDFRLPEYGGMIIEYFGVQGDHAYDKQSRRKQNLYQQAGIEAILLTRDSLRGDWPTKIIGQIEDTLKNRLRTFYNRKSPDMFG
jgi:hypothetical protein